jgi:hypothetical protein
VEDFRAALTGSQPQGVFHRRGAFYFNTSEVWKMMKEEFWNVLVEIYRGGTVKAAVIQSREAEYQPPAVYRKEPGREVFSLWYGSGAEAESAVLEALAMEAKEGAAA